MDHEFYCSDYASKEQPHAEGLLQTLHDAKVRHDRYAAQRKIEKRVDEAMDITRRVLHMLVAATNRRMHKGFPTIYAYLLGKPTLYASHEFVKVNFELKYSAFFGALCSFMATTESREDIALVDVEKQVKHYVGHSRPTMTHFDYDWRPVCLGNFP